MLPPVALCRTAAATLALAALAAPGLAADAGAPGPAPEHATNCINDEDRVFAGSEQVCTFACERGADLGVYLRGWQFMVRATCGGATLECSVTNLLNTNEQRLCAGGLVSWHDDAGSCEMVGRLPVTGGVGWKHSVHCDGR